LRGLIAIEVSDEFLQKANKQLLLAIQESPEDFDLAERVGNMNLLKADFQTAAQLYQLVKQADDTRISAQNSLALVLGEIPGRIAQGLELINELIVAHPGRTELLDTKAALLIVMQRDKEAMAVLEQIKQAGHTGPASLLHEALIHKRSGDASKYPRLAYGGAPSLCKVQVLVSGDSEESDGVPVAIRAFLQQLIVELQPASRT
jgi:hypothetical protein